MPPEIKMVAVVPYLRKLNHNISILYWKQKYPLHQSFLIYSFFYCNNGKILSLLCTNRDLSKELMPQSALTGDSRRKMRKGDGKTGSSNMFIFCLDHKWRQDVTGFMGNEDVSNLTLPSEQVLKAYTKDKKDKKKTVNLQLSVT